MDLEHNAFVAMNNVYSTAMKEGKRSAYREIAQFILEKNKTKQVEAYEIIDFLTEKMEGL